MADVARGHGGDCFGGGPGGNDPPGGGGWQPPNQCQGNDSGSGSGSGSGRGKRGRTTNAGLRKILESRKGLLDISFDQQQGTYRPVGSNAKYFASLVGTIVERLPQNTAGWLFIPQSARDMVLVEVGGYFNMEPHLTGPNARDFRIGLDAYFAMRYRSRKHRFKQRFFTKHGGEDAADIGDLVPPDMAASTWNDYIQHYTSPSTKTRSEVNKRNKQKQKIKTHGGRTSLANFRQMFGDSETQEPAGPFEGYRRMYVDANGTFHQTETRDYYAQMTQVQSEQASSQNPLTERDIMLDMLGRRRGWVRGIGPIISGSAQVPQPPPPQSNAPRMFSEDEVQAMIADRLAQERQAWTQDVMSQFQSHIEAQIQSQLGAMATTAPALQDGESSSGDDDNQQSLS